MVRTERQRPDTQRAQARTFVYRTALEGPNPHPLRRSTDQPRAADLAVPMFAEPIAAVLLDFRVMLKLN